ncbi:hypothetical protein MR988_07305 [bacterium]|jgi:hypothetical protein|nr:hypothetical protein [uncultured Ruminococcus sp.]MCI7085895.1 hypothetical protein [bacterium]
MDSDKLVEWLVVEKQMGTRSAKDILSRCGRVYRMLGVDTLDENSLELLQQNEQFKASSMFVKSQLKRTVTLCLEFMKKEKE